MISYFQLQRLASDFGVSEETIEKDFLIELILFYFARNKYFLQHLIFRGGTALKKIYFSNYRFSEDIDLLLEEKEELNKIEVHVDSILKQISSEYPFRLSKRFEWGRGSLQVFILYDIFPEIRAVKELKLDIRQKRSMPGNRRRNILFNYQEFKGRDLFLKTYNLESVISDKICRILDFGNEPRDIYDLWFLLKKEIDYKKVKIELKNTIGYEIFFSNLLSIIEGEAYRQNWKIRLEKQVPDLMEFEPFVDELKKLIHQKLIMRK